MTLKFRELHIGETFDFINDDKPMFNSFYLRCKKISARKYQDEKGTMHHIGSINAIVHHVESGLTFPCTVGNPIAFRVK